MNLENNGTVVEEVVGGEGTDSNAGGFDMAVAVDTLSADLFGAPEVPETAEEGEAAQSKELPKEEEPAPAPEEPKPESKPAPKTWRPEAAAVWETLPLTAQEEILKREEDIFRGIEQYKTAAGVGEKVSAILAPYQAILQQHGIDPFAQIQGLMNSHYTLAFGSQEQKTALLHEIIRNYGLSSEALEVPYVDPQVTHLQKEIEVLKSAQQQAVRTQQEATYRKFEAEVAAFASEHEHFDEVANDIAALLKSGVVTTLADAYDRAVWANPLTRAKQQQSLANAEKLKRDEEAAKAKKAMAAGVRTASRRASDTTATGSIEDTLAATLAAIKSRN